MPKTYFKIKRLLVPKKYKLISEEIKKIRPGFAFLPEFLLQKPPSKTGMWLDFIKSKKSPYAFIYSKKIRYPKRNKYIKLMLMQISKFLSKKTYNPHNIPLNLLQYFDTDKNLISFLSNISNEFKKKYKMSSFDLFSGPPKKVSESVLASHANLIFANFSTLDDVGHKFGPNSSEYSTLYENIFLEIKKIQNRSKFNQIEIMSDHGMYPIKNYIDYRPLLKNLKIHEDLIFFANSPVLRFWINNKKIKKMMVKRLLNLEKTGIGKLLTPSDYKKFKFPTDQKFGELIFWLKKGNHFIPDFFHANTKLKGMHGYLEYDKVKKIKLKLK